QHKLHSGARNYERKHSELLESSTVFDHALLNPHALTFERAKQLLYIPTQPVPADNLHGLRNGFYRMRRHQPPMYRLFAGRGIKLPSFDSKQFHFVWCVAVRARAWPTDTNPSKAHRDACLPSAPLAWSGWQIDRVAVGLRKTCQL